MRVTLTFTFATSVAMTVQLLIFAYQDSRNRLRFFGYLVWLWGLLVVRKLSSLARLFVIR